jgi:hypothetical protein
VLIRDGWLTHLAVNCHTDQLLGAVLTDSWNVERRQCAPPAALHPQNPGERGEAPTGHRQEPVDRGVEPDPAVPPAALDRTRSRQVDHVSFVAPEERRLWKPRQEV